MKRLICIFTIIISFFIFDFSFKEKSWDEYVTGKDFILNIQEKTNSKLVSVNFEVDRKNKDILFDELLNFADENNYGLIASTSENLTNYNELQSVYLYPSDNKKITDLYTIKELNAIDFSREGKEYITTDLSDMHSSHHIYYLDQEYNNTYNDILNIYPMKNYQLTTDYENKQQMYFIFIIDNIEDFTNEVNSSKLVDYLPNDYADNGLSEIHGQVDLKENSFIAQRIIVVTALTILLLLICLFIKNRKEIILRKQYGMSNHYIILKMFVPIVLLIALVYSITQIICYGLYIGNFYRNGIDFILFILKYYVGVILLLVLILVVLYFMVRNIRDINFIKREKLNNATM